MREKSWKMTGINLVLLAQKVVEITLHLGMTSRITNWEKDVVYILILGRELIILFSHHLKVLLRTLLWCNDDVCV